jgi:Protein of Unknown function (DUF2784)
VAAALADAVVLVHVLFVVFVAAGGLLVLRWPRLAWLHVPAFLWGAAIELGGWICPLTPLENRLRRSAGEAGYPGGFIDHTLIPALYPEGLTRTHQLVLGLAVLAVNLGVYGWLAVRAARRGRRR